MHAVEARRVSLVALNGMAFDLSTPAGRMVATVRAGAAFVKLARPAVPAP